ncbi:MAG: DUF3006 domain-containing protein [Eubacteriales bacterium]|nr:DUF3006 domain-containing protein [Eubacteriales bacterium]MDY4434658.1 DUF3006 domain-containing protein [Candidatus Flemingibacterium sp.]
MKKIYVLDRIEEGTAILISDDEEILKISPAGDLAGHRSGDVFTRDDDNSLSFDEELTTERRAAVRERMKRLIRKHSPDSQE